MKCIYHLIVTQSLSDKIFNVNLDSLKNMAADKIFGVSNMSCLEEKERGKIEKEMNFI